jgi:two-component system alkaline phosphatase synthesis response regulator PhoP
MMKQHILMVEDEEGLIMTLGDRLTSEGYELHVQRDGESGYQAAVLKSYDIILLDIMLPRKGGYEVLRDLRHHGVSCPVIMLSAKSQTIDKVLGLKLGADDYVTKPFDTTELLARIEAAIRRSHITSSHKLVADVIQFGSFELNTRTAELRKDGHILDLSAREYHLLRYFLAHPDEVLSRDTLLNEVWGYDAMPNTRTVDVHIAWLRQKLEDVPRHPRHVLTIHGLGYRFIPNPNN